MRVERWLVIFLIHGLMMASTGLADTEPPLLRSEFDSDREFERARRDRLDTVSVWEAMAHEYAQIMVGMGPYLEGPYTVPYDGSRIHGPYQEDFLRTNELDISGGGTLGFSMNRVQGNANPWLGEVSFSLDFGDLDRPAVSLGLFLGWGMGSGNGEAGEPVSWDNDFGMRLGVRGPLAGDASARRLSWLIEGRFGVVSWSPLEPTMDADDGNATVYGALQGGVGLSFPVGGKPRFGILATVGTRWFSTSDLEGPFPSYFDQAHPEYRLGFEYVLPAGWAAIWQN